MKILKYIGYIVIESIILMIMFFISPTIIKMFNGNIILWVYIILSLTILIEYLFLFFKKRSNYFTVPLSLIFLLIIVLFYFNSPDNTNAFWAVKAVFFNFMMPIGIVSILTSSILYAIEKFELRK